jgi:hypothetical protein
LQLLLLPSVFSKDDALAGSAGRGRFDGDFHYYYKVAACHFQETPCTFLVLGTGKAAVKAMKLNSWEVLSLVTTRAAPRIL